MLCRVDAQLEQGVYPPLMNTNLVPFDNFSKGLLAAADAFVVYHLAECSFRPMRLQHERQQELFCDGSFCSSTCRRVFAQYARGGSVVC